MGNLGKIGKPQKSKKHKKLKPVDPFNRSGRAAAAEAASKTDKTPKGKQLEEQEMTRSMREFIRNKKIMEEQLRNPQKTVKKRNPKINDYQTGDDRRGMTRPIRPVQEFHKRKGERDGHFVSRASAAAAAVVGESRFEDKYKLNANPTEDELEEKKNKKEEWKAKKAARKENRKRKRQGETVEDEILALHKKNKEDAEKKREAAAASVKAAAAVGTDSVSPKAPRKVPTDFCDLKDHIGFGEVAMAPPILTAKPRKAEMKDVRNNLLLSTMVLDKKNLNKNSSKGPNQKKDVKSRGGSIKKQQKLKELSALQKSNLMNERQRVVDKYRKLKGGNLNKLL